MPIVLCNAGPLMALGKLNRLDLLARLYGEVQIPRAVYDEETVEAIPAMLREVDRQAEIWVRLWQLEGEKIYAHPDFAFHSTR